MEKKINNIVKILNLADAKEEKSFSIFDQNENSICAIGSPKVTEADAVNIRQFITSTWKNPVRMKVGKFHFMCVKLSSVIVGKGNFNVQSVSKSVAKEVLGDIKLERDKLEDKVEREEDLTLTATLVDELTVIMIGRTAGEESLVEQIKTISAMLSNKE